MLLGFQLDSRLGVYNRKGFSEKSALLFDNSRLRLEVSKS